MVGFHILVWAIVLIPLVLIGIAFTESTRLGLACLGLLLVSGGAAIGLGFLCDKPRMCPACRAKELRLVKLLRCNPPPCVAFHRCGNCGGEYLQFVGDPRLIERKKSEYRDSDLWNTERSAAPAVRRDRVRSEPSD